MRRTYLEWDRLSVYNYKEENIQEMIVNIYSIIEDLKANGKVVPPELLDDIRQMKEDMKTLKSETLTELKDKVDNAIQELLETSNNNAIKLEKKVDDLESRYSFNANNIKDGFITEYRQQLTGGDDIDHQNPSYYGKVELNVRNGIGVLTGLVKLNKNASEIDESDIVLAKGCIATKQVSPIMVGSTAYQITYGNYASSVSIPMVVQKNGNITVDKAFMQANTNNKEYISINATLPIFKSYVLSDYIKQVDADIEKASDLMQENVSTVVISCDAHIRPTQDEDTTTIEDDESLLIPMYTNYVNTRLGAFATICNGDTLTESLQVSQPNHYTWLMESVRKMYTENTLFVLGNHDDQSLLIDNGTHRNSTPISKELFNRYLNKGKTGISFAGNNQPYYTADDTKGRCRHLILNSHDAEGNKIGAFTYSNGQLKWLIEQLINTPSNYSIVIYSHTSPMISSEGHRFVNAKVLHQILKAYKEKSKSNITSEIDNEVISFDFTNAKGLIAGIISGHEHIDKEKVIDGLNYVIETSSAGKNKVPTYTIAQVDLKHRILRLLRAGIGRIDKELSF